MSRDPAITEALRARAQGLGLDAERIVADLPEQPVEGESKGMLARVALFGDEGDWPKHMVEAARREYAQADEKPAPTQDLPDAPEACPFCGGTDIGTWGDTEERTEGDHTDYWECNSCRASGRVMPTAMEERGFLYGVCIEGVLVDDAHEFRDGLLALRAAERVKANDREALVTICLWNDDDSAT